MEQTRVTFDPFLKWLAGITSAVVVMLIGWIAASAARIPVIENQIAEIRTAALTQVTNNKQSIDDHETRLRVLEGRGYAPKR